MNRSNQFPGIKFSLCMAAMLLSMASHASWTDGAGNPVPDKPSMRSSGDFGAQLILTGNAEGFRKAWNATTGTPTLPSSSTVRLGQSISAVIVFGGCKAGVTNKCQVSVDFALLAPDGTKTPVGNGPVWSKEAPKPRILMLGDASVTVGFEKNDPPGIYTLIAKVKDRVANQNLQLTMPFTVTK